MGVGCFALVDFVQLPVEEPNEQMHAKQRVWTFVWILVLAWNVILKSSNRQRGIPHI